MGAGATRNCQPSEPNAPIFHRTVEPPTDICNSKWHRLQPCDFPDRASTEQTSSHPRQRSDRSPKEAFSPRHSEGRGGLPRRAERDDLNRPPCVSLVPNRVVPIEYRKSCALGAKLIIILIIAEGPSMYLCICNAITDHQARSHGAATGCTVAAFYRALGVKPKCGKCAPVVREILDAKLNPIEARQDTGGGER